MKIRTDFKLKTIALPKGKKYYCEICKEYSSFAGSLTLVYEGFQHKFTLCINSNCTDHVVEIRGVPPEVNAR